MSTHPAWLGFALSEPEITDICLNGAEQVYIDNGLGLVPLEVAYPQLSPSGSHGFWTEEEMRSWVLDQISAAGKSWDARHPFIDASLASGHRIHVAFPPLSRHGILVSLRRLPGRRPGDTRAEPDARPAGAARWGNSPIYGLLSEAVKRGESILVAGATGSGKTTLATDLLEAVPASERILALEDTPELAPRHPHFISMISRAPNADGFGEVTLRTLLKQALRMRPDRIILGECRGNEVLDLLQALNTGHSGALATLHANSPRDALRRIELLCLLASGGSIPLPAIRELLAVGVQWIVQVKRLGKVRQIVEVAKIEGREGDVILLRPVSAPASASMPIPIAS